MVRRIALVLIGSAFALPAVVGWSAAARADNAAAITAGLTFPAAVQAEDLADQRGAGLEAAVPDAAGEDKLAVILWDEFKPHQAAGSVVHDGGMGSSLASSITGTVR